MTTFVLLMLLVIADGDPKTSEVSRHPTRTDCALAAHKERTKPWPDKATVRVFLCREVKGGK